MRNISDQSLRENQNKFYVQYFIFENVAVYEVTWKNVVEPYITEDAIIRRMRFACWIVVATDTHSAYVMHIDFPQQ
jgi:hypothetical protein